MPTVNVYYKKTADLSRLTSILSKMKDYFAKNLTCGDIKLTPEEISIRFIQVKRAGMIGDVELEISAHSFPERVKNQDKICLDTATYVKKEIPSIGSVKVWLKLSELGHSW